MIFSSEAQQLFLATINHHLTHCRDPSLQTPPLYSPGTDFRTQNCLSLALHFTHLVASPSGTPRPISSSGFNSLASAFISANLPTITPESRLRVTPKDILDLYLQKNPNESHPPFHLSAPVVTRPVKQHAARLPTAKFTTCVSTVVVATGPISTGRVLGIIDGKLHYEPVFWKDTTPQTRYNRERYLFGVQALVSKNRQDELATDFFPDKDFCIEGPHTGPYAWTREVNDVVVMEPDVPLENHKEKRAPTVERMEVLCLGFPVVFLVAVSDMVEGEELVMDYGKEDWEYQQRRARSDAILKGPVERTLETVVPVLERMVGCALVMPTMPVVGSKRVGGTLGGNAEEGCVSAGLGHMSLHGDDPMDFSHCTDIMPVNDDSKRENDEMVDIDSLDRFLDELDATLAVQSSALGLPLLLQLTQEQLRERAKGAIRDVNEDEEELEEEDPLDWVDVSKAGGLDELSRNTILYDSR
ncbi:hypothetical protein HDU98_007990 [Podochytrium sp. JEL0797]|nr:hypothetical protein HDU98_007990 [Podochytrium sp. JEL0797]